MKIYKLTPSYFITLFSLFFLLSGCSSSENKKIQQNLARYLQPQQKVKTASYNRFQDKSSYFKDEVNLNKFKIEASAKDIASWRVTYSLSSVRFTGNTIVFETEAVNNWRVGDPLRTGKRDLVGNAWIVDLQTGKASTWEWMRKGQKSKSVQNIKNILKPGGTYGFFLSTFARNQVRSTNERTNIVLVRV